MKPDDARLFDLLAEWAPGKTLRRRILVENPEIFYGFAKAA
jgi:D-galactarolactone isomerase